MNLLKYFEDVDYLFLIYFLKFNKKKKNYLLILKTFKIETQKNISRTILL